MLESLVETKLKFIILLLCIKVVIFMDTVATVVEFGKQQNEGIASKFFKPTQF